VVNKDVTFIIDVLLASIILSLFYIFGSSFETFSRMQPHPIYILASLIAMRNGNVMGVLIALIMSVLYTIFYFVDQGSLIGFFAEYHNSMNISITFLATTIFGIGFEKYRESIERRTEKIEDSSIRFNELRDKYYRVNRLYHDLKIQVVNSDNSLLNLYEISQKFNTFNEDELFTELVGIMSRFLKTDAVSIYNFTSNGFMRLKIKNGEYPIDYSIDTLEDKRFELLIDSKKPLKKSDVEDPKFPVMAAPIIIDDLIEAVVCIDDIDFSVGNEYSFQIFKMIIDWFHDSLRKIDLVNPDDSIRYYDNTKIMKYKNFLERLETEKIRRERYSLDYVYMIFNVNRMDIDGINRRLQSAIRSVDVVSFDEENSRLHILLPATSTKNEESIRNKILERLRV